MALGRLGKLTIKNSALFLCDMQEKFRNNIQYFPQIVEVSGRMLKAASLGRTVSELDVSQCPVFAKTRFSMVVPEVELHLKKIPEVKSIILCGIEAQACVLQSVLDLLERKYEVHVVADAVSSRTMVDRMYALQRMKDAGAFLSTSESILFLLLQDAAHPKFREIQQIIWNPAPDSGLLCDK